MQEKAELKVTLQTFFYHNDHNVTLSLYVSTVLHYGTRLNKTFLMAAP